ncbi:uncharacterized protein TNCV_5025841 [Trichonephila clavipes]|uniref:Uncharacterized protein n=1 Tax=Trichonephila clavipes TaxID=2585209 RepID=A0A8X6V9M7_TRICX|nr:uncharacterized protein TNCV_5025841 [Trichonephila clavipes]
MSRRSSVGDGPSLPTSSDVANQCPCLVSRRCWQRSANATCSFEIRQACCDTALPGGTISSSTRPRFLEPSGHSPGVEISKPDATKGFSCRSAKAIRGSESTCSVVLKFGEWQASLLAYSSLDQGPPMVHALLQKGLNIHQCAKKIRALQTVLKAKREEFVDDALIYAKSLCEKLEISFEPPRRIRRKHVFGDVSKDVQLSYEDDPRRTMFFLQ